MGKKRKSDVLEDADNDETPIKVKVENGEESEVLPWEVKASRINAIASPLAPQKMTKRLLKLMRKSKNEGVGITGLKGVKKALVAKRQKGIVVLAGDVEPVDIYSHFPVVCEDRDIPYCYLPSREDMGQAIMGRSCILFFIPPHKNYQELYDTCKAKIEALPHTIQLT